jgi:hypothetical protein
MTIDLTGSVPQVIHTCDHCGSTSPLYRLIGTSVALCRGCFARLHG